jgi:hypothetical protein
MLYIQIGGSLWYWSSSTFWGLLNYLDLVFEVPLWLASTNRYWGRWCWDAWSLGARPRSLIPWCLPPWSLVRCLIPRSLMLGLSDERPDSYSSTSNFHIGNACVRTMIGSRLDGWSRIGNFLLWCTRVQTTSVRRPDGHIWIAILALRRLASRRDTTSSRQLTDLPFLGTWKEIRSWSSTGRRSDVLLKRLDGCKLAQKLLDTVWGPDGMNTSFGRMMLVCLASERDDTSSGRMEQWTDGHPDGMAQSSGRLTGNLNSSDLQTLNSGIPVYSIFTRMWFCPNTEWGQITNTIKDSFSCFTFSSSFGETILSNFAKTLESSIS